MRLSCRGLKIFDIFVKYVIINVKETSMGNVYD